MTAEEVVDLFEKAGGTRGATATESYGDFRRAAAFGNAFVPCECSWRDPSYAGREFIARGPDGGLIYIGMNDELEISCGTEGYHWHRPDIRRCV